MRTDKERLQVIFAGIHARLFNTWELARVLKEQLSNHEPERAGRLRMGDMDAGHMEDITVQSLVLLVYGMLESSLNDLARAAKRAGELDISLRDMSGTGIYRAALYLQKVARVPVKKANKWSTLLLWGDVRNGIIHGDGLVTNRKHDSEHRLGKELADTIGRQLGLQVNERGYLGLLTFDHLDGLFSLLDDFYSDVAQMCECWFYRDDYPSFGLGH